MRRGLCASVFLLLAGLSVIAAQEQDSGAQANPRANPPPAPELDDALKDVLPAFRDQALVLDINARVLEQSKTEIWKESHRRVTIPGRPVDIKLVGVNIAVAVQFIPYLRGAAGNILVIQGQIWVEDPSGGVRYQTTMQAVPLAFDEPVYFFPLGSSDKPGDASIEIVLTMQQYRAHGDTGTQLEAQQPGDF